MSRPFVQVDVFTDTRYGGNPVAVVLDGEGLSAEQMQRFAHWTNLSETTFLLPPSSSDADYRVRIFTPVAELPFAGHPTLGSCHAWLAGDPARGSSGTVIQECAAGLVRLRAHDGSLAFQAPPLLRSGAVEETLVERIAEVLQIGRSQIQDAQWVDNGPGWVAVLLDDAEAVLQVRPDRLDFDLGVVGLYPPGSPYAYEVRGFFPQGGSAVEDPVTGSLNASLAQWLTATGRVSPPYVASQGTVLGRTGRIRISQDGDGAIWVGGGAITCLRGEVEL